MEEKALYGMWLKDSVKNEYPTERQIRDAVDSVGLHRAHVASATGLNFRIAATEEGVTQLESKLGRWFDIFYVAADV